jgi:hypothetical protein
VPVCHVIPVPFPSVWHSVDDDGNHIDLATVIDLATIFRVFIIEFYGLNWYY